ADQGSLDLIEYPCQATPGGLSKFGGLKHARADTSKCPLIVQHDADSFIAGKRSWQHFGTNEPGRVVVIDQLRPGLACRYRNALFRILLLLVIHSSCSLTC